jgi:Tol biopolymer transport system component
LSILDIASHKVNQIPGSVGLCPPRWSPDGRFIAALTSNFPNDALKIFDMETERWSILATKRPRSPSFSRDGRYIFFLRTDEARPEVFRIYRIQVKGGEEELVADLKDWRFTSSYWAWMGLDPDDAPLLMRDTGSTDLYALTLEEK